MMPIVNFALEQKKNSFNSCWYTVWKFQDFSVIQILREVKHGESRRSKTAVIAIFGAMNCVNLAIFSFQKLQKCMKIKIQIVKMS